MNLSVPVRITLIVAAVLVLLGLPLISVLGGQDVDVEGYIGRLFDVIGPAVAGFLGGLGTASGPSPRSQ